MNKLVLIICLFIIQLTFNLKANCQANILFPDVKDSASYKICYFVYAESKLGDFRDDVQGVIFKSQKLNEFFRINNRKVTNVIFLRILTSKRTKKIEQIHFYSIRDQDIKLIEELTLLRSDDSQDIDLLVAKIKL